MAFSLLIEILNMRFRGKQTKKTVGPIRAAIDDVPPT
jgi:hypothetical protein